MLSTRLCRPTATRHWTRICSRLNQSHQLSPLYAASTPSPLCTPSLPIHTSYPTTSSTNLLTSLRSLHTSSRVTHTRTAVSLITRTHTITSLIQPTRLETSHIIPKQSLTRSFASQSQGQGRDDRGGVSMPVFQIGLTILRVIFRALPWIWRSQFVQNLRMKHPYFLYGVVLLPAGLTLIYIATHIEFVPYSGRIHLTFLNRASEMQLGNEAYQEIMTREHARILPADHPTTVAIREIASDLLNVCIADGIVKPPSPGQPILVGPGSRGTMHNTSRAVDTSMEPAWEVNVIESTVANAFVLPNGKIFVYTGLLPIAQTTGGLASVMGHEISHQLGRHAIEKLGIVALLLLGYELVQGYRDASGHSGRGLGGIAANFLLATIVQVGLPLAHSRKMETEADRIGMTLMSRAAYDPKTAIGVWERMKAKEEKGAHGKGDVEQVPEQAFGRNWRVRGAELLSTHPASETRIGNMLRWLDSVRTEYITAVDRRLIERLPIPDSHRIIHHVPLLPPSIVKAMDEQPDAEGLTTSLRADRASSLMVGRWGEVFDQVLRELQSR